jgi:hypothetical protein
MWIDGSLLSQEFTHIPSNQYLPDLSTLRFCKTATVNVFCLVSLYRPFSNVNHFSRLELILEADKRRRVRLMKEAFKGRNERLREDFSVFPSNYIQQPTPTVVARIELTRLSPSSIPVVEESQEQSDSWPVEHVSIAVNDVGPTSSSVDPLVHLPQPRSETNEVPTTVPTLEPLSLVACKLSTRIGRVLVAVSVYGVTLSQLCSTHSALSLSNFAWIPGEEIPPEPPPCLPVLVCSRVLFLNS